MGLEAQDKSEVGARAAARRATMYVRRFPESHRDAVRALTASSARMMDLAVVFPAAIVAIVTDFNGREASRKATTLVEDGAALRDVIRALALPMWLRRLPPETFVKQLRPLPGGETFSRRISTRTPASRTEAEGWFDAVIYGVETVGEDFAVWIARQPVHDGPAPELPLIRMLAAYAWFSSRPDHCAHGLIATRWRPDLSFETAICGAKAWLNRLRLVLTLEQQPLTDAWLTQGEAGDYRFVPLLSAEDILAEARGMHNCVDQYGRRLSEDRCRLFGIRTPAGLRVATLEVGQHHRESGFLTVNQLKGRHNLPAPSNVWQAVYAWLASQSAIARIPPTGLATRSLDRSKWIELMQPLWQAQGARVALPRVLTAGAFDRLEIELAELARRGRISSWLFT
jgi:hypothetical protein